MSVGVLSPSSPKRARRARFALRLLCGCGTRRPKAGMIEDVGWRLEPVFAQGGYAGHASPFGSCVAAPRVARRAKRGGARRDRTADLLHAMQALSQLSYGP